MQNGDVVLTFDGKPVADNRALPRMVADAPIGKTVNIEIMRRGQKRTLPITVQRLRGRSEGASANPETSKQKSAPRAPTVTNLGMTLAPITGELRRRYRLDDKVQGVVVTDVDGDSPAGLKNIRSRRCDHRGGTAEDHFGRGFQRQARCRAAGQPPHRAAPGQPRRRTDLHPCPPRSELTRLARRNRR